MGMGVSIVDAMLARFRTQRRVVAPYLATVLVATGALVPILDAGSQTRRVVIESEHDAATCVVGHDHTICTQVGSNLALAVPRASHSRLSGFALQLIPPVATTTASAVTATNRSRAPPHI